MRKYSCIALTFFMLLLFAPEANAADNIKVSAKAVTSETKKLKVDLRIPVVSGMDNRGFQKKINTNFKRDTLKFRDKIKRESEKNQLVPHPYEAVSRAQTHYTKNNILSITIDYYSYTGGAHGMTVKKPYNYDLIKRKMLLLEDLFKPGYDFKTVINSEIRKQIEANRDKYFPDAFKTISANQPFYIIDGNIVVYFGLYEIAPYVSGIPEFKIPVVMLKNGLKPEYLIIG